MLCWLLLFHNANQLQVYTHPLSLEAPSHPPDPIPPLEVVAEHWLSSLCYIELPVAICFAYGNVYVSVLLSQFVSPSPPHAVYTSLFSISVSLFLPCKSTCLFLNFFKLR